MALKRLVRVRALLFVSALGLALPAFSHGVGAQSVAAKPVAAATAEQDTTPVKNDASHQGIKVHGHWKIVVRNADGSIASTTEFENSLTQSGGTALASLVSGTSVSAGNAITLLSTGNTICGQYACGIVPGSVTTGPFAYLCSGNVFPVVCVTGLTQTASVNTSTLAGQMTASQAGSITSVNTYIAQCPYYVATNGPCTSVGSNGDSSFTAATLPSAISVSLGQTVQVTVTFSFA